MRKSTAIAWGLAFCVTGCGKNADPAPDASDSPAPAQSVAAAAGAIPQYGASAPPSATAPTAATKPPAAISAIPTRIRALGTEPFWNARISGGMLTYATPEDQSGQRASLTRQDQANGTEFSGKLGGAPIHIAVTKQTCSDGMSDRSYPFTVVLTLGSDRRQGCAS